LGRHDSSVMAGLGCTVYFEDYIVNENEVVWCKRCEMFLNGLDQYGYHAIGGRHIKIVDRQKRRDRGELSDEILSKQLQEKKLNS
jgi:hypothetical protein